MRKIHTFDNGIRVYDDHLLEVQRRRYALHNVHEADEEELFLKIIHGLPSGACYVNVGGAIGYYCIMARKTRPDLRVLCFEPLPRHLAYFRENIPLNGLREDDFSIHPLAVSARAGRVVFQDSDYASSLVAAAPAGPVKRLLRRLLGPSRKAGATPRLEVDAITLAGIFQHVPGPALDFLQMDIQGFEQPVLEQYFADPRSGAPRVRAFLVGTHSREIHEACARLFRENGYELLVDEPDTTQQPDGILHAVTRA